MGLFFELRVVVVLVGVGVAKDSDDRRVLQIASLRLPQNLHVSQTIC
jgi:hypothetical protein